MKPKRSYTPPPEPRADGLCLCNCGQPVLPGTIYASSTCCKRFHKRKINDKHKAELAAFTAIQKQEVYKGVKQPKTGAIIYYREGADPDVMSQTAALKFLHAGAFRDGDIVQIGDKRITIGQERMF
jgi:hypothetical protein